MQFPHFLFRNKSKKKAAKVKTTESIRDLDYRILEGTLTELNQIRMTAAQLQDRRTQYNAMAQLQSDAVMGPTFEVYATNATPSSSEGHVIWAIAAPGRSPYAVKAAKAANALIQEWELDWRAYKHIYEMVCYGNLYLKTTEYIEPVGNQAIIRLNERNPNSRWNLLPGSAIPPGDIYELTEDGSCVGFVVEGVRSDYRSYCVINDNKWAVESTDSVIHFIYNPSLYSRDLDVTDAGGDSTYQVVEGDPPFISAYTPAQILSLLEDALVANRVTRSALLRILQVEVGDCSPQEETRTLDKVQRALEHKLALSTSTGTAQSYADPGPLEKIIYTATRNGKGVINVQTLGGDVNVRDIVDLDYFKEKLTSITDVSPGNLSQSTNESGSGGATILTQNNIRLYRKIISLQHAYEAGIKHAVNLYFKKNNLESYIDQFEIKMQRPLGPEDELRSSLAGEALQRANDIISLLEAIGITDSEIKIKVIKQQLDIVDPAIYNLISDESILSEQESSNSDEGEEDSGFI